MSGVCCWTVQVETIGDAYMVSSGIPIYNPRHAPELADMALTLCHGVTKYKVMHHAERDLPKHRLPVHEDFNFTDIDTTTLAGKL